MEFGPRALGNRSILADASNPNIQSILNQKIKFREGFRPFAPIVLEEDMPLYFEEVEASPYMLFTVAVKPEKRSEIPGVTHVDGSARVQTVNENTQSEICNLLHEFKKVSGKGILVNTSFNVRGEPPVCTPEDAYQCFMHTDLDVLVMGNYVLKKEEQKPSQQKMGKSRVLIED
jgi:carbamoyltransferase